MLVYQRVSLVNGCKWLIILIYIYCIKLFLTGTIQPHDLIRYLQ